MGAPPSSTSAAQRSPGRRRVIMSRIFHHHGSDVRSAPLPRQVNWGAMAVTHDGAKPPGRCA